MLNTMELLCEHYEGKMSELPAIVQSDDPSVKQRKAEMLYADMYACLSRAHNCLAYAADSSEDIEKSAKYQDLAERYFDLSESFGREAFSVNAVHVARYTESPEPFKIVLGGALSTDVRFVSVVLIRTLCRIMEIDPDVMVKTYREWTGRGLQK